MKMAKRINEKEKRREGKGVLTGLLHKMKNDMMEQMIEKLQLWTTMNIEHWRLNVECGMFWAMYVKATKSFAMNMMEAVIRRTWKMITIGKRTRRKKRNKTETSFML